MAYISHLSVSSFRNLGAISIEPSPTINIIVGENGAGKSSILEGISMLAHGRSFRTHKFRSLINNESSEFIVRGTVVMDDDRSVAVGLKRGRSGPFVIKLDGKPVASASLLAKQLPLLVINSNSFRLLEGGAQERRKFFDWLVFHVKHQFQAAWNQLVKCYKQRNILLRHDKISYLDVEPWDIEIAKLSKVVNEYRLECFGLFERCFKSIVGSIAGDVFSIIEMKYKSGWKVDAGTYLEQLKSSFMKDKACGYSTIGSHKSDFSVKIRGAAAVDILSRGQQKTVISALYIAQATLLSQINGDKAIFAIDDLPAELDQNNQRLIGSWLSKLESQVFVTGIDSSCAEHIWPKGIELSKLFHVKHGEIQ